MSIKDGKFTLALVFDSVEDRSSFVGWFLDGGGTNCGSMILAN